MDLIKIIAALRTERDRVDQAIAFLEGVTVAGKKRGGGRPARLEGLTKHSRGREALLKTLAPRDERIIRLRFGIGHERKHTLEEVGQEFKLTRERIRQIEARALRRLGSL
jgi:hypothetical protein